MRNIIAYVLILVICGTAIWVTLAAGRRLEKPAEGQISHAGADHGSIAKILDENLRGPLAVLLTQVVLIVLISQALGKAATKVGQPQVVGEMIAGILMGPSFLGQISPSAMNSLFPATSMDTLRMLSRSV
jgi:hypothetical protein